MSDSDRVTFSDFLGGLIGLNIFIVAAIIFYAVITYNTSWIEVSVGERLILVIMVVYGLIWAIEETFQTIPYIFIYPIQEYRRKHKFNPPA